MVVMLAGDAESMVLGTCQVANKILHIPLVADARLLDASRESFDAKCHARTDACLPLKLTDDASECFREQFIIVDVCFHR